MRGTPSTSDSMIAPKLSWSCVCLKSWFSTTCGLALRLSSITRRIPWRFDSSRRSAMSFSLPPRTSSAIFSASRALFTWYGSSVTTIRCRPCVVSSIWVAARTLIEPRPVHQQVREPGGKDRGLLLVPVVVGDEVDGLGLDVAEDLQGDGGQPGLGVAHGGWRVSVDRAEVAVRIH